MKTKLLIFKFKELDSDDFDYDDFKHRLIHDRYLNFIEDDSTNGGLEISSGVFRIETSDFTHVYTFISKQLGEYKKYIQHVYVMDGDLSSDASDLIQ